MGSGLYNQPKESPREMGIAESISERFSVHDELSDGKSKKPPGGSTVNMGSVVPVAKKPQLKSLV
jgi:hypothetical protein